MLNFILQLKTKKEVHHKTHHIYVCLSYTTSKKDFNFVLERNFSKILHSSRTSTIINSTKCLRNLVTIARCAPLLFLALFGFYHPGNSFSSKNVSLNLLTSVVLLIFSQMFISLMQHLLEQLYDKSLKKMLIIQNND
uniref:Uncharacterized protein n=1 Tax=Glossina pallidipes TaxID=7398 RepID=A0A1B0A0W7_GLOPL